MVQRRAARYVMNRYRNTSSVTSMLEHLEWECLEARRAKHQLTVFFKIVHGLVDIPATDYLTPASNRTRSQHSLKFRHIPTSSDYYKFSFFPSTVRHWNSLSANVAFKLKLSSVSFSTIRTGHVSSQSEVLKLCWRGLRVPWCRHGSQIG